MRTLLVLLAVARVRPVELDPEEGPAELVLVLPSMNLHIRGFVHDAQGAPIAAARVVFACSPITKSSVIRASVASTPVAEENREVSRVGIAVSSEVCALTSNSPV